MQHATELMFYLYNTKFMCFIYHVRLTDFLCISSQSLQGKVMFHLLVF